MQRPRILSSTTLCVLLLLVLSFGAYRSILTYSYTDVDTFDLIWIGRIYSFSDVIRIFSTNVGGGPNFYRPISQLTFGLDNIIWKDNPFGYHLTDLVLHSLNAVLLFFLAFRLLPAFRFRTAFACLPAALFAISPTTLNVVESITNRHDSVAALFSLSCLLAAADAILKGKRTFRWYLFSLVLGTLAIFSKESTYVLPVLLGFLCFVHHPTSDRTTRLVEVIRWAGPLLAVVLFNAWLHIPITGKMPYMGSTLLGRLKTGIAYPFYLMLPTEVPDFNLRWQAVALLLLVLIFAVSLILLTISTRKAPIASEDQYLLRTWAWVILFLLCYGFLYMSFGRVRSRYVYTPAIAYSLFLVCLLLYKGRNQYLRWTRRIVALAFIALLVFYSPLLSHYSAWERSSQANRSVLEGIRDALSGPLAGRPQPTIYLVNLPVYLEYRNGFRLETAGVMRDYSMDAWARMRELTTGQPVLIKTITHVKMSESPHKITTINYEQGDKSLVMQSGDGVITPAGYGRMSGMPITVESSRGLFELLVFHRPFRENEALMLFHGSGVMIRDARWVARHAFGEQ